LESLVGEKGEIPKEVEIRYIEILVDVYLSNGNGIAHSASIVYEKLLGLLNSNQALVAVMSFRRLQIASKLQFGLCSSQYEKLLEIGSGKVTSPQGKDLIGKIQKYNAPRHTMNRDTRLMEEVQKIGDVLGL